MGDTGYEDASPRTVALPEEGIRVPHSSGATAVLVIVSGSPGAGKSTLAARLGAELHLPILMRDAIKEALFGTLGASTREQAQALGRASYDVLGVVVAALLAAGKSVVVESNFRRGMSEPELRRLLERGRGVLVHCVAGRDVIEQRYRARHEAGLRHPVHRDAEALPDVLKGFDDGEWEPLDLEIPLLCVDTSEGYQPAFEALLAQIRQLL